MIRSSLLALLGAGLASCHAPAPLPVRSLPVHDYFDLSVKGRASPTAEPLSVDDLLPKDARPDTQPDGQSGPNVQDDLDNTMSIRVHIFSVPDEEVPQVLRRPLRVEAETPPGSDTPMLSEIPILEELARSGLPVRLDAGAQGWHAPVDRAQDTIRGLERSHYEFEHLAATCNLGQTANLVSTHSVSFVESFRISEQKGVLIANPVIDTAQNGLALNLSPRKGAGETLELNVRMQLRDLVRPMVTGKFGLPPGSNLAIHLPLYVEQEIQAELIGSDHDMFVLCTKSFFTEGHTILTFIETEMADF